MKLTAAQIAGIVKYNGASTGSSFAFSLKNPDTDGPIFVAIALTESQGETTAKNDKNRNGTTDFGLWQINSVHKDILARHQPWDNPNQNYEMAYELYHARGFKFLDWTGSYTNGLYAAHMPEAVTAWNNPDTSKADKNAVSDAANTTYDVATGLADLWDALGKSSTWVRIGMGAGGALLLIICAATMVKNKIPLPGPAGALAKAVT